MTTLHGILYGHFETGTEGTQWIFLKDGLKGYDAFEMIEEGDRLCIFDADNKTLFDGIIKPDYEIGWAEYPLNPGFGQPAALGYWIHWTQDGFQPNDWAQFFIRETPLRATLVKAKT